jgi:hypothetical protein
MVINGDVVEWWWWWAGWYGVWVSNPARDVQVVDGWMVVMVVVYRIVIRVRFVNGQTMRLRRDKDVMNWQTAGRRVNLSRQAGWLAGERGKGGLGGDRAFGCVVRGVGWWVITPAV